jgi:hypothetical protein
VCLGREARHVADRPDDPRGQYGIYAEDLGEGGAGSLHLGFDEPIQLSDLPIQRADSKRSTSEANRRLRRAEAPLGRMARRMRAARLAESVPATPPGRRSRRRSPCRRLSARVRSATRSISASRKGVVAPPRRPRDLPLPAAPCARRPERGGEGMEAVVLAGVASEAREHPHPCRKLGWHVHHRPAGRRQAPR